MAKKINKCFSGHFYEKQTRQAGFLFIFFYFPKIDEATFLSNMFLKGYPLEAKTALKN